MRFFFKFRKLLWLGNAFFWIFFMSLSLLLLFFHVGTNCFESVDTFILEIKFIDQIMVRLIIINLKLVAKCVII